MAKPALKLSGRDGNIFNIVGRARRAMEEANVTSEIIDEMCDKVSNSSSYDEALQTVMRYCEVS